MDQCNHCTLRGDLEKCEAASCSKHTSWYATELKRIIQQLKESK